jgi:hypothetical protein
LNLFETEIAVNNSMPTWGTGPLSKRASYVRRKRRGQYDGEDDPDEIEMTAMFTEKCAIVRTNLTFNADSREDIERAAMLVWRSDLLHDPNLETSRSANAELVTLLLAITTNTYLPRDAVDSRLRKEALWQEGIMSCLTRIKSQKDTTLVTVRTTVEAVRVQLNQNFWQLLHQLAPGAHIARILPESQISGPVHNPHTLYSYVRRIHAAPRPRRISHRTPPPTPLLPPPPPTTSQASLRA